MQIEMREILKRIAATAVFVTHDQDEALVLSDRIVVMDAGRREQTGTPAEIYGSPATPFVLDFVGQSMQIRGRIVSKSGPRSQITTEYGTVAADTPLAEGTSVLVAVRPENIVVGSASEDGANRLQATVRETVYFGARTHVLFEASGEDRIVAEISALAGQVEGGSTSLISWPVPATLVYPLPQ
jgi:putative spermidine/putrescine transport system ATP-binding protein